MSTEKLEDLKTHSVTLDTLKHALEIRDLFVYSGLEDVNASCVVCLFGFTNGYTSNRRSCVPNGAPLDYLLVESPVIISNLWVVTAKSCEVLATKLLESLLKAASTILVDCNKNQQTNFGATRLSVDVELLIRVLHFLGEDQKEKTR
ncbi:hypothetical protein Tco_1456587 [Tanacetum coccineum]